MKKRNTKEDFIVAFWKLYEKKEIEKIFIHEICKLAGYNRTTFYVYYENIYDLLNKAIENIFIPIKKEIICISDFNSIPENNIVEKIFLNAFIKEDKHIELLFKGQHYFILGSKIKAEFLSLLKDRLKNTKIDIQSLEYIIEYHISAVLGVIKYWFQTGKSLSENELIEMIYNISTKGALTLIIKEFQVINSTISNNNKTHFKKYKLNR